MCSTDIGYATPLDAMRDGPREELLYVICVQPFPTKDKTDALATVDVDPKSPTYCQVISKLYTGNPKSEIHHSGWNICSSCHSSTGCPRPTTTRDKLILPALGSNEIYVVDVGVKPRSPKMHCVVPAAQMEALDCGTPHTTHCLASGEIMISTMGDKEGNGKGEFVLLDGKTFDVKATWTKGGKTAAFGYDFWYQPSIDIMIASEWGAPRVFKRGFQPHEAADRNAYGTSLNIYSWSQRKLIQTIDLGMEGLCPLEVRFLHDPRATYGFVGCAVYGNVYKFEREGGDGSKWVVKKVIDVPAKKVSGWIAEEMQSMITDILISLDDKFLYFSNWLHGDVRQYDISDPDHPKLTGQVFLGGQLTTDSPISVVDDPDSQTPIKPVHIKGKRLHGSPQMLQLSLDGKRLYVSSSLFSPWDRQFYPTMCKEGGFIAKLDVDVVKGGMTLDKDFLVSFDDEKDGAMLPHEMRYPGGDCTSDIWLAK